MGKTDDDVLDILVVLDRSGSMATARADHEGGLKSFVEDQAKLPGDVRFTLVQFDSHDPCEVVYDRVPIGDVKDIVLIPRGGTPLLDAVGRALAHLSAKTDNAHVIVMVVTDGEENESREWTKARVAARVEELEKRGYAFLFLGADMKAFGDANAMGFQIGNAVAFDMAPSSVNALYQATAGNLMRSRSSYTASRTAGISASASLGSAKRSLSYTGDQRKSIKKDAPDLADVFGSSTLTDLVDPITTNITNKPEDQE